MTIAGFESAILLPCNVMGSIIPSTVNRPHTLRRHTMFHKIMRNQQRWRSCCWSRRGNQGAGGHNASCPTSW